MILSRRKNGSQRAAVPMKVTVMPNMVGQNGSASIIFQDESGDWISITPETTDDVRELMRQAHVVAGNFKEPSV